MGAGGWLAGWLAVCGGEERRRAVMHGTDCSDAHHRYLCSVVQAGASAGMILLIGSGEEGCFRLGWC